MVNRRSFLAMAGAATFARAAAPSAPVSIARCKSYDGGLSGALATMFDQLGGLGRLVNGKTVTIKLNMTGSPALRTDGLAPGITHYCHPKLVGSLLHHLGRAGAKRVRLVESAWGTAGPLDECMLDAGWNVRSLQQAAPLVEFENTNALGTGNSYARLPVPGARWIYPAYDLNRAFADTDVFVSLAKLKQHADCGVTLSLKNCFGNLPASIYGDDAGEDEPNERPTQGRLAVCHLGKRQPARSASGELDNSFAREAGSRVPRITAEVCAARPIDLAIIDGIESMAGGEGPWIEGVRHVKPGVLIAGLNPVATDAVSTAVMGFDPRATRGSAPFQTCDNTLLLAEELGLGTADLDRIDVRGLALREAVFRFVG